MELGFVGVGMMGMNMVMRLQRGCIRGACVTERPTWSNRPTVSVASERPLLRI
jgi:3-hydroxyisobutyrate dehydrogenase-like beta-hydroxyacid dehydrogenase